MRVALVATDARASRAQPRRGSLALRVDLLSTRACVIVAHVARLAPSSSSPSSSPARAQNAVFSQVQVHPVVLMSILDHHIRREAAGDKVIGALLGTVGPGGVVEVTNSFGIFHKATQEEILVRRQTLNDLLELHRRVDPAETLVGWYSSWRGSGAEAASTAAAGAARTNAGAGAGAGSATDAAGSAGAADYIDQFTLVVQDFFAEAAAPVRPLHLLVDVSLKTPQIRVVAYQPVLVRNIIAQFAKLNLVVVATTEERVAVDAMAHAARLREHALPLGGPVPFTGEAREVAQDLDALESSLRRLKRLVDSTAAFVDDVVAGRRKGTEAQGRAIADAVSALPSVDLALARLPSLGLAMKDMLLVTYLTQLAQVHLRIADRIPHLPTSGATAS